LGLFAGFFFPLLAVIFTLFYRAFAVKNFII